MKKISFLMVVAICSVLFLTSCKSEEARNVEQQISSIGDVTEGSYAIIQEARQSYDALSNKDKKSITNYSTLETAELTYNTIFSEKVDELIASIGAINDESGAAIDLARSEYDKLSKDQKALVKNFGDLINAEKEYENYIINRSVETLIALTDIGPSDIDKIELAESIYHKLTDEQKLQVINKVGDIDKIIESAKYQRVEKLIELITYKKGEPDKTELNAMIDALTAYIELDRDLQAQVTNYDIVKKALKGYSNYKKDRAKKDPLYIREMYIKECKAISYDDLMTYPSSYKGQKVSFEIQISEIEDGILILPDSISAVVTGTEHVIQIKDNRSVKEPVLSKGDTFTVYGIFKGTTTVKVTEEGSGLFGSNLFGNISEKYDIPIIEFIYTSNDNLGIIVAGDPGLTDLGIDEEAEELKNQLDQLVTQLQ